MTVRPPLDEAAMRSMVRVTRMAAENQVRARPHWQPHAPVPVASALKGNTTARCDMRDGHGLRARAALIAGGRSY